MIYIVSMPEKKWFHINAEGKTLGRLASQVANILRGKNKRDFSPHINGGDFVIVTNAEKIKVSAKEKMYYTHSGWIGGIKSIDLDTMRTKHPDRIVKRAVKGMLPKNRLQARFLKQLKVYRGEGHPHVSQKPQALELKHHA